MPMILSSSLMLASDGGKLGNTDQESPNQSHGTKHDVRDDDAEGFMMKIRRVGVGRLHRLGLSWGKFDAREDEDRPRQSTGDIPEWIKGSRKIQPLVRSLRVADLDDERVGCGFKN